jgi:membrane protein YqaA with SNARE-associated domain
MTGRDPERDATPALPASRPPGYRTAALLALGIAGAAAGCAALLAPQYRQLVVYGLYAIPAHLIVSFLPHEPAVWVAAQVYPPLLIAIVGTAATVVAIVVDYWLLGWLLNHHLVRPVVQDSRWFQFAKRWFTRAPALLIVGSALAPVPFYPVKFLAIASDYPLPRFIVALIVGRLPRFYFLAVVLAEVGERVQARNSTVLWIMLALVLFGAWRIWRGRRRENGAG